MTTCLIVQPIHAAGLAVLEAAGVEAVVAPDFLPATIERLVVDADAVITRNAGLSSAAISAAPRLRVIAVHGIGTDPVALDAATERGIPVVNTPHANVRSVAEHTIALTMALVKSTLAADAAVRRGDFSFKYRARLGELHGARLGAVGFGNIGRTTAAIAAALRMRVAAYSTLEADAVFEAAGVERKPTLDALLSSSDIVTIHLPLTAQTRNLIGARELGLMKPGAYLVNTARGEIVDEEALADALQQGHLAGAGLDVFSSEPLPATSRLLALDSVVMSPHIAGSTEQSLQRTAVKAAEQVVAVLSGRPAENLVNIPSPKVRP